MKLAELESLEIAQRKAFLRLIKAEFTLSSIASRVELKICRDDLRATRSEIRKLRKTP